MIPAAMLLKKEREMIFIYNGPIFLSLEVDFQWEVSGKQ